MVNYKKNFTEEFGIHFKGCAGELRWALDFIEEEKKKSRNETLDELLKKSSGGNWRRVAEQMKTK